MHRYALFAAVATGINIGSQILVYAVYAGQHVLWVAMGVGTATGLVVKYLLDGRWIFNDVETSLRGHSRKFSLYVATGAATTALFWLTEWSFQLWGGTAVWRYTGAVLGLAAGYTLKYHLDRRFVFGVEAA